MKKTSLGVSLAIVAVLAFGATAFAQRGGGRPAGVGGGSMGGPPSMAGSQGMSGGMGNRPNDPGFGRSTQTGRPQMSTQAPQKALSNPHLDSSLTNALGKSGINIPGGNLQTACAGFKNLGQCVAALHVAKNLGLNFSDLQSKMTGSNPESLGKAIQDLGGPNVSAKSEAKKANKQATHDVSSAEMDSEPMS